MLDLIQVISYFIGNGFISIFSLLCWNKLECLNKTKSQVFLTWILITSFITISNCVFPNEYKLLFNLIILIFINYLMLNKTLKQAIILVVISQITISISEFSFAIIVSFLYNGDIQELTKLPHIFILLSIYINIVSLILQKLKFTLFLYNLFNPQKNKKENMDSIIYSVIMIIIMVIATIETYMELSFTVVLITNTLMATVYIGIVIASRKLKDNYDEISSKYETSIYSLKEYEVMIDKFRVYTHENKNEFYTIRNMLKNGENRNEVIKYIDTLIDNKIQDNEKIMAKTAKIPSGGLRATIYSKLCLMDKLKIKYKLNISRDVRTTDLIDLDEDLVLNICKILGVFLDNAIEAVKDLKKKQIVVEMYIIDNDLCIDITNNFKGNLDINKISEAKYTTKGDGHGYGLTLVNQIINKEIGKLENEKSINRDTFTQTLKIKKCR